MQRAHIYNKHIYNKHHSEETDHIESSQIDNRIIWASSCLAARLPFLETGQYIKSNNKVLALAAAQAKQAIKCKRLTRLQQTFLELVKSLICFQMLLAATCLM